MDVPRLSSSRDRLALLLGCLVLSGCLALPSVQTGRALGAGHGELRFSATSACYSDVSISGERDGFVEGRHDEGDYPGDYVPVVGVEGAFGVGARTDVGLGFNSAQFLSARVRHQVVGTAASSFAVGVGAEGGVNPAAAVFLGVAYLYGTVPVYASFHPTERVALYVVPRYTVVTVAPVPESGRTKTSSWRFPGLAYGVALGERHRLAVELAHADGSTPLPSQVSVAFVFRPE